jgi:hypothetical protein
MAKDGKEKYQRGKARDEKSNDDKDNEEKGKIKNVNDKKEDANRSNRVVIKSYPTKPTRIMIRGTKSKPVESRPPWNTGSPSPTTTRASVHSKRSIRVLSTKLHNHPKVHSQEEPLSSPSLEDDHQVAASKAEPPLDAPSPTSTNLTIPPENPKTGLEWGYKQLEEFLQHTTGATTSPRTKGSNTATSTTKSSTPRKDQSIRRIPNEVGLQEARFNADPVAAEVAAPNASLGGSIKSPKSLREQMQEESFLESELMTSSRLRRPVSSPAMTKMQLEPHKLSQTSMTLTPSANDQLSLDDKLASERRRGYILAVLAQRGKQNGSSPTQALPDPDFQLDQESANEHAAPQRMTPATQAVAKTKSPTFIQWPTSQLQPDPEMSEDEQTSPQPPARAMPNMIKVPSASSCEWPAAQLQLDLEDSDDENASLQSARSLPSMIQVPYPGGTKFPIQPLRLDLESADEERPDLKQATRYYSKTHFNQEPLADERPATQQAVEQTQLVATDQCRTYRISKSKWAQIVRGDSPFNADGESSGDDHVLKWRSLINRSRQLRQSRSHSSIKSVKWDPAIIAYGPITATREPSSQAKSNAVPEVSEAHPKKSKLEDNLEVFRKTVNQWKKGDRKAIRNFLEALRNLDSDEESISNPKQASKKEIRQSKTFSNTSFRKGLNPLAPAFQEPPQKATDDSQREKPILSVRRKRPHFLSDDKEELLIPNNPVQICKPIPRAIRSCHSPRVAEVCKEEPIWVNTFQSFPTISPDQEDDDFQEFCKANNYIPIAPVNLNPIIPIAPPNPIIPFLAPYHNLELDPASLTYTLPLHDMQLNLPADHTHLAQPAGKVSDTTLTKAAPITQQYYQPIADQDFSFTIEETSELIEDEGWREAKALDPLWGAQILENFMKKYPMTGQPKTAVPVSEQNENRKVAPEGQPKSLPKVEGKASGVKAHIKRAAEIQQKLEIILLQQRERKAPLAPAHKMCATEIQQKLEIMLYKLKEQKALQGFSKRVPKRVEIGRSFEKSFEKNSEKDVHSSRSTSKSSKGTVEHIEKLR